jgi:hypothetical protein
MKLIKTYPQCSIWQGKENVIEHACVLDAKRYVDGYAHNNGNGERKYADINGRDIVWEMEPRIYIEDADDETLAWILAGAEQDFREMKEWLEDDPDMRDRKFFEHHPRAEELAAWCEELAAKGEV